MSNICIIGSLNTEIILGPAVALPEWGNQILVNECDTRAAGSAMCVAMPLAALGVKSDVVGSVGDDDAGRAIIKRLAKNGLAVEGVRIVKDRPTGICVSIFAQDGERLYVSSLGAITATTPRSVHGPCLARAGIVLVTGLFVLPGLTIDSLTTLFRELREREKTRCLDTGWDPGGWTHETVDAMRNLLAMTDVFLPNDVEARAITGARSDRDAARALRAMGPGTVIVKRGPKGALGVFDDELVEDLGFPAGVRDTTAAGEAFNAGVLYAIHEGLDPARTLRLANAVASLFLEKKGEYGTPAEVRRLTQQ